MSASSTKPKKKPATGSGASKAAFAKSAPKPKPKPAAKPALKAPPIQPQTSDPKGKGKEEDVGELSAMIRGEIDAHAVGHSKSVTTSLSQPATCLFIFFVRPGLYLALDCEMVGVGPVNQTRMGSRASESSLARVSIVNFHGVVMLDCYVKQREKVTDYRTQWSGVRAEDLVGSSGVFSPICGRVWLMVTFDSPARPFVEVQKNVAGLLKDRVLVGHAVANDLKVRP